MWFIYHMHDLKFGKGCEHFMHKSIVESQMMLYIEIRLCRHRRDVFWLDTGRHIVNYVLAGLMARHSLEFVYHNIV